MKTLGSSWLLGVEDYNVTIKKNYIVNKVMSFAGATLLRSGKSNIGRSLIATEISFLFSGFWNDGKKDLRSGDD